MTLDEIRKSDRPFLNATDIAQVIGTDPNSIRMMAQNYPEKLGFPVTVIKKRVRHPSHPVFPHIGIEPGTECQIMVTKEVAIEAVEEVLRWDFAVKAIVDEYLELFCGGMSVDELNDVFNELVDVILEQAKKTGEKVQSKMR